MPRSRCRSLGSLILTHDFNGVVPGLKDWPRDQRAPVAIPFFAFRIMVGLGLLMLALVAAGLWLRLRGRLTTLTGILRLCQWAAPIGFVAVIAGWTTTEVGRQPWTVYGVLRTGEFGFAVTDGMGCAAVACGIYDRLSASCFLRARC